MLVPGDRPPAVSRSTRVPGCVRPIDCRGRQHDSAGKPGPLHTGHVRSAAVPAGRSVWLVLPVGPANGAPPHSSCLSTPEQTAPYVAFQGARATILAEESSSCGQRGRVCRVFWRQEVPWVVLRCHNGLLLSVAWHWTDLPIPPAPSSSPKGQPFLALLAPQSLVELVRFVRYHAGTSRSPSRGEKGGPDDSRAREARCSPDQRSPGEEP
jgi:hypothetical protein